MPNFINILFPSRSSSVRSITAGFAKMAVQLEALVNAKDAEIIKISSRIDKLSNKQREARAEKAAAYRVAGKIKDLIEG